MSKYIPRRISTGFAHGVTVTAVTAERVTGLRSNTPFNVKHDGKKFSVGSGSGKVNFYFADEGKAQEQTA